MFDIHLASLGCYTYSQFNRNRSTIFGKKSHKQWTRERKQKEEFYGISIIKGMKYRQQNYIIVECF